MPIEIVVPRLGWSMDEGTFGEWLKKDGDQVNAGDMIFILEGEKASQEIESFDSGTLHIPADAPKPGDTVAVGQLLGYLLAAGEVPPTKQIVARREQPAVADPAPILRSHQGPAARRRARELAAIKTAKTSSPTSDTTTRTQTRIAVTPRARRKARELGVDWNQASGTGRNGRVRERDIVTLHRGRLSSESEVTSTIQGRHQPASKIRSTIAQRMLAGIQKTAPVTLTTKVDASKLVAFRETCKRNHVNGVIPTYNDIITKLVACSLPKCPELNACWINNGIYLFDEINIAIAIDAPNGLVAPVIRDAESLSLNDIAKRSATLAEQARTATLAQHQLEGGTFTITNLGMFDIDFFTPIINLPQSAILGIGRIVREPIVAGDQVVPGHQVGLSLTFDHRVIDGAPAARWLQRLANMIQQAKQSFSDEQP